MNKAELTDLLEQHVALAQDGRIEYDVLYENEEAPEARHEFLFFVKPEITLRSEAIKRTAIFMKMFDQLQEFRLHVRDIRILSATYLRKYNIIAQHYGVINALSRHARSALSTQSVEELEKIFKIDSANAKIVGSLEFLEEFPSFTPVTLDMLWQKCQAQKLAPGTYCAEVTIDHDTFYLINGFHPRQLTHFTDRGRSIIGLTLVGDLDWKDARTGFIGSTNPANAKPGSLRNEIFRNREKYGLETVSSSWNGFHLSAGPVESLVELIRYNSNQQSGEKKNTADFQFGRQLERHFSPAQIETFMQNPMALYQENRISIFDLTEEKNNDEAIQLLKECTVER